MLVSFAESIVDSSLTQWIQGTYWLWPVMEITHFIGLTLLLGGLIVIDLRMAGFMRSIDPATTHKLLPAVIFGFSLNLITGILFFYGDPMRYAINIGFQIKMVLVLIAGINAALYHFKVDPLLRTMDRNLASPIVAKLVAFTSLGAWTGVLLLGRLIPYVGTG
ncbi:MAG: hypothetical protein OXU66_13075 [Gammaproteobacteria bacterium]|nr:hypothetical protein [Gammaproteobacteria bacterium]MDD9895511.1 hypothetical protein [Gammaproteobacteria bacterium]MDD9959852.1 hypothetical protein [Gammaproteobacteria bacterium]